MTDWGKKISGISVVPSFDEFDLIKSKIKKDIPTHGMKSFTVDPLDPTGSYMGYKDRKYQVDYNLLRRIPNQLSVIAAILQTRSNQVAAFSAPYRSTKSIGFQVKHRNSNKISTKGEREMILSLENFIYNCGHKDQNPHSNIKRDKFKDLLKKLVKDSLTLDAACFEIVPDRRGLPAEFLAVDAATIRLAAPEFQTTDNKGNYYTERGIHVNNGLSSVKYDPDSISFVQILDNKIENVYTREELVFGIRNPRTDIRFQGYGESELEMLINTITSHLNAEEYNRRFFTQGCAPKGMINFKGDVMTPDQLEGFKRMWRDQMEGVSNSWRTPIFQTEGGIEWVDLSTNNRDMEYHQWVEYLLKIGCSVFNIDPSEIGFDIQGGVSQTPLFESSQEWKLKASRDKGLRPLLRFFEDLINENIIERLDDDYVFQFVGLDELTEEQKHDLRKEQVASYMTLNEIRRAEDLPDLEGGNIPLNPTYIQYLQFKDQKEQAANLPQGNTSQAQSGQTQKQHSNTQQEQPQEEDIDGHVPQYVQ